MATKRATPMVTPAEWPPERGLRAVRTQLDALIQLKPLPCQDGEPKEEAWEQVTGSVLRRAFSSDSEVIRHFRHASSAGSYNIMGVSQWQRQANYVARLNAYEIALNTAIADLEMSLPEQMAGIYEANDPFAFYLDLRENLDRAAGEIFIVDAYIDQSLFELYLANVPNTVRLRVLTSGQPRANTVAVAALFAKGHPQFELRNAVALHDRVVFVDDRCWVVGQSIKDAAVKKPTYMVEVSEGGMRAQYEPLWINATMVVRS